MAFDIQTENKRHLAGWQGFCKFSTYSIVVIVITLLLLAKFVV